MNLELDSGNIFDTNILLENLPGGAVALKGDGKTAESHLDSKFAEFAAADLCARLLATDPTFAKKSVVVGYDMAGVEERVKDTLTMHFGDADVDWCHFLKFQELKFVHLKSKKLKDPADYRI